MKECEQKQCCMAKDTSKSDVLYYLVGLVLVGLIGACVWFYKWVVPHV